MTLFLATVASAQEKRGDIPTCPVKNVESAPVKGKIEKLDNGKVRMVRQEKVMIAPARKLAPAIRRVEKVALPVEK